MACCVAAGAADEGKQDGAALRRERLRATVEGFVKHVAGSSFDEKARAFVVKQWAVRQNEEAVGEFLCEALAVLDPRFKEALGAYEADDLGRAKKLMKELTASRDPYLSTNALVFEIRSMVETKEIEAAAEKLSGLSSRFDEMKRYTVHVPGLHFLLGFCGLQQLDHEGAAKTLSAFLDKYAEASPELRSMATQILRDLSRRKGGDIGAVAELMGYAERKLLLCSAGESTQARQAEAVALLDKLIAEAEECEKCSSKKETQCQKCGGKGCKACSGKGASNALQPKSPAKRSQVTRGATKIGPLKTVIARPAEQWGQMRAEQRERILQSLRGEFPSRYRELVKQYFQTLSKEP